MKISEKRNVLGVGFTTDSEDQILEYITQILIDGRKKVSIVTPNPEMLLRARKDDHFNTVLNSAHIALPDGVGVVIASKALGGGVKGRITGVDFVKSLTKSLAQDFPKVAKRQASIGFLGGRGNVAERTAVCLSKMFPGPSFFVGKQDVDAKNYKFKLSDFTKLPKDEKAKANSEIPKRLDVLFVAFGFPAQEKWINANLPHIPVTVAMGVGGAFDILSGNIRRAPRIVKQSGMEWLWRLGRQPWRIRRQIKLVQFPFLIVKEKFKK